MLDRDPGSGEEMADIESGASSRADTPEPWSSDEKMREASEPESDPYNDPRTLPPAYCSRKSSLASDDGIEASAPVVDIEMAEESVMETPISNVEMAADMPAEALPSDIEMTTEAKPVSNRGRDVPELQPMEAVQSIPIPMEETEEASKGQMAGSMLSVVDGESVTTALANDDEESVYESEEERDMFYDYDMDELEEMNEELRVTIQEVEEYAQEMEEQQAESNRQIATAQDTVAEADDGQDNTNTQEPELSSAIPDNTRPVQSESIYAQPEYLPIDLPIVQLQPQRRMRRRRLRRQRADPHERMQDINYYNLTPSPE
ncbi:hypothetical protein H4R20_000285 [Coemansia guatemalensis]|uniref:Uncharacterized protein n=1 Tax=Coemansia guatemalensis TaxID=2761395 RepID=A0A9W8LUB0_9FUNG|nr:hypothetical protein H4R20_000285 [Coemansia guatemalensis]